MASRSLSDLTPKSRELCLKWIDGCKKEGIDVLVYCTFRDGTEQDSLYSIGRTKPGKIVTNARAGDSWHNWRMAWDAVPLVAGKPAWNDASLYAKMGRIAESMGIEWAGRWTGKLKETAHFQVTEGFTLAQLKSGKVIV